MSTPLRLLLVEDSARDAALLVRLLRQGQFEVVFERVETVAGMETALEQGWDLIIADHSMPSFGAEAALEMLQLRNLDLPLIMVSGTISDEAAIEAMKRGAADYLLKDRLNRLGEAVHRVLAEKRLRAEKEEAEARIRFQARLLEAVEQAVIATNLDGIIIYWNTFAERLRGWTAAEVVGRNILDLAPGMEPPAQVVETRSRLRAGASWSGEYLARRRDGSTFPVLATCSPLHDWQGTQIGIVGVSVDITERKQAEEALQQSEARFRTAFEDAAIGMTLVALSGRLRQVNTAFRALLGYSKDELLELDFQALTHPDDLAASLRHSQRLLDGETDVGVLEKRYLHRNGQTVWVQLSARLQRDAAGQPLNFINQIQDITGRRQAEQALRHQASHDSLTNLPNRALLRERLGGILRDVAGTDRPFSLVLLDLDRFKDVNDTLGHHIGDDLLRQAADRLLQALGATETVARLGGDEFAMLLPAADATAASTVARLVLATLEAPFQVEQHLLTLDGSIGIAVYPEHGTDPQTLLRHADVAMYEAKRSPTGVAVYDSAHDQHTIRRLALMHDLRTAIREEGLRLYYQPKVELPSGQVCGVEALLRWSHPVHGFIPPIEFIPLAEQTGTIVALTEWVLVTALARTREWQDAGRSLPVAINLSARSLQDQRFPDLVARNLERYQCAPTNLTLEITESSLMADPVRAHEVLTRLHDLGVRTAIDDFGTGYSSLAYLKQLPVDEVKIDKSFVLGMGAGDEKDAAIVRSIVALAHALGKIVVAEGVEDAATYTLLGQLGCDALQGYYLSRPLPPSELEQWLSDYRMRQAALRL